MDRSLCILVLLGLFAYCNAGLNKKYFTGYGYNKYAYSYQPKSYLDIYKSQGFKQVGNVIVYRGSYYDIKCNVKTFYIKLNDCYTKYRGLNYCLYQLSNTGYLYRRFTYTTGYHWGVYCRNHGIVYQHYYYKILVRRSVFVQYMTKCYNTYHHASYCVPYLVRMHIISSRQEYHERVTVSKYGTRIERLYKAYHGWTIVNGGFIYNGHRYKLSCTKNNFYNKYNLCYGSYHDRNKCFYNLQKQHLFVAYAQASASAASHASSNGAVSSARAHAHASARVIVFPWKIVNRRFTCNNRVYQLDCTQENLYNRWNLCYRHYYNRDKCFGILYGQNLFHVYVAASAQAHAKSSVQGGSAVSSASARAHAHAVIAFPWPIYHNRFTYNRKVYQLDCTQKNLYNQWNLCYGHYYNKDRCFGMLYGQKLFHVYVSASAQAHAQSSARGGNAVSSAHAHAHARAVIVFPWKVYNNRFTYNRKVYQLDCTQKNLYNKWNLCYRHYYNRDKCFGLLYGQKLFHIYVSASAHAHARSSAQGGNAVSSASAHARAHTVVVWPWTIYNNRFTYNRKVYQLDCTQKNLYYKWNLCYRHYYDINKCFGMLYGQKLFHVYVSASAHAHAQSSAKGGNAVSSARAHARAHAVIVFPWKIYNNRFTYNRKVYQLDCTQKNLYNQWNLCYRHYYNRNKCFGMLYGQKLFHVYVSASAHAHAKSSAQGGRAVSSASAHAHAVIAFPWPIYHNRFTYNRKVYQLDCTQKNLYYKWNLCYRHYYNKDRCFGMLYGQKLFHVYVSASAHAHASARSFSRGGHAVSSAHAKAQASARVIVFPWPIYNNRFNYNNKASASAHTVAHASGNGHAFASAKAHAQAYFTIVHKRFTYNGLGYRLGCDRNKFYNLYDQCYARLHSCTKCLNYLIAHKLLYKTTGPYFGVMGLRIFSAVNNGKVKVDIEIIEEKV